MTNHNVKVIITASVTALFLLFMASGCTKVGPDYVKPDEVTVPTAWESNLSKSDHNITTWWKLFNDPTLDVLVEKTYEQNLDLRSAGLRILQARAALGISEGLLYPQQQAVSGSLAAGRAGGSNYTAAGVNFDVGWEMDVWGKYARGIESAEATLYASVASYDDILVSIIAEVARNYISFRTAQERIQFAERNILIQEAIVDITQIQFNAGNVSELDMQQAMTQLYTTQSLLPALELSKIKSRNAIAILLGTIPQEVEMLLHANDVPKDIDSSDTILQTLQDGLAVRNYDRARYIPTVVLDENITIDADLVRRRPDLQVAELQTLAQNARIGAAKAELYPHFSLFGNIGYNNQQSGGIRLSAGDAVGISAGPAFSWNIFQYGRIKDQVRLQDALFQESLTNYNKKVLLAVQEVSNALNGYTLTKEQLEFNAQAIKATVRAFDISIIQYNDGLVGYQRLLISVQDLTRNEDQYAQIQGNIATQVIALYKALGGGWQMDRNNSYINDADIKQMQERTDWGEYLDENATLLPKYVDDSGMIIPISIDQNGTIQPKRGE
jgi:outer membrane protein TolC